MKLLIMSFIIIGCGNPDERGIKHISQSPATTKKVNKSERTSSSNNKQMNSKKMTKEQCAINMSKLAILAQEADRHGGIVKIDDDVWCPTNRQLQETRDAIDRHKQNVFNQKVQASKQEDDEEEARIRAQANREVSSSQIRMKIGNECYTCPQGMSEQECFSRRNELTPYNC